MGDEEPAAREPRPIQLVEDRWANLRHIVEAVAIVAAGLWAFYIFVYQEDIKPANDPAAVVVSISIHRLGRDAIHDILVVNTDYHNVGKTEIDIAADGFDLWGIRYDSRSRLRGSLGPTKADIFNDIPERSRTLVRASMELRAAAVGGDANRHVIMEPGSTETLTETVVVPRGAYDALEAFVIASPIKTSEKNKVNVAIVHLGGGLWLRGVGHWNEDDNRTEFALIP